MIRTNDLNEKVVFYCNFDNATNSSACDGFFTVNSNGNQVGLFKSIEMKYDITDFTSLSIFFIKFSFK